MLVESCIPVIPSADLERSLRFWVDGLALTMDRAMRQDGRLIGCMVHNERLYFWLNQRAGTAVKPENYHGIQLYWAPSNTRYESACKDSATPCQRSFSATMVKPNSL